MENKVFEITPFQMEGQVADTSEHIKAKSIFALANFFGHENGYLA